MALGPMLPHGELTPPSVPAHTSFLRTVVPCDAFECGGYVANSNAFWEIRQGGLGAWVLPLAAKGLQLRTHQLKIEISRIQSHVMLLKQLLGYRTSIRCGRFDKIG